MPEDPGARLEAVQKHMAETRTGFSRGVWLSYLVDDVRPELRNYFLKVIREDHEQAAIFAIRLLDEKNWMEDQELREALRDYYLDPKRSRFRRLAVLVFLMQKWPDYPEFQDLPTDPPMPEGYVHVEEPT